MNFIIERIDKEGTKCCTLVNVISLDGFAEEAQDLIDDSIDNQVILKIVDREGKLFPEEKIAVHKAFNRLTLWGNKEKKLI